MPGWPPCAYCGAYCGGGAYLRLRCALVPGRSGLRRRGGPLPAAEQPTEETAALLRLTPGLLRRLLRLLQLCLHLLHPIVRLGQRVLLHEGKLGQAVARIGVAVEQIADQRVGVTIDGRQRGLRRGRHRADQGAAPAGAPTDAPPPTRVMKFVMMSRSSLVMDVHPFGVCGVDRLEPAMWRGPGLASMPEPQPARFDHRTAIHYHDQSGRARPLRGVLRGIALGNSLTRSGVARLGGDQFYPLALNTLWGGRLGRVCRMLGRSG